MTSFSAKYYRDYSSLAVYGHLFSNVQKNNKPKKTTPKVSDLTVYGNLSVRPSKAQQQCHKSH